MLNFYIKSFNVCLTAAGNRAKWTYTICGLSGSAWQNHGSYIESKKFSEYIYDQSDILDLVTSREAIA